MSIFYLIWSFLLLGFLCVNFLAYKYYRFHIAGNKKFKEKIKNFNLFFAFLSCWPLLLFLAPVFDLAVLFLWSANLLLISYLIFLLYSEYKLSCLDSNYPRFKFDLKNISFCAFLLFTLFYTLRQKEYDEGMLYLFNLELVFLYLLVFMQIKTRSIPETDADKTLWNSVITIFGDIFCFVWQLLTIFAVLSVFVAFYMEIADPKGMDTCMDTGVCKEGFVFDDCGDGKPCTITKEYCLSNNNVWNEKNKTCNLRKYQN